MTPFLLEWFHRESHGASLTANVAIILANAGLAARIAVAAARADGRAGGRAERTAWTGRDASRPSHLWWCRSAT